MNSKKMKSLLAKTAEKWYALKQDEEKKELEVRLYDVIGGSWFDDSCTARRLCGEIAAAAPAKISLRINSPGGSVTDGLTIYNYLRGLQDTEITVHIDGIAASIASVIAMAGSKICIARSAFFHMHRPWCLASGNAAELRGAAQDLDTVTDSISEIYRLRSGRSAEEIADLLKGEEGHDGTMLSAAGALLLKLVDEIEDPAVAAAACIEPGFFDLEPGKDPEEEEEEEKDPDGKPGEPEPPADPEADPEEDPDGKPGEPEPPADPEADPEEDPDGKPGEEDPEKDPEEEEEEEEDDKLKKQEDRLRELSEEVRALKAQADAFRAHVMGRPVEDPEPADWADAVRRFGYEAACKKFPALRARVMEGGR